MVESALIVPSKRTTGSKRSSRSRPAPPPRCGRPRACRGSCGAPPAIRRISRLQACSQACGESYTNFQTVTPASYTTISDVAMAARPVGWPRRVRSPGSRCEVCRRRDRCRLREGSRGVLWGAQASSTGEEAPWPRVRNCRPGVNRSPALIGFSYYQHRFFQMDLINLEGLSSGYVRSLPRESRSRSRPHRSGVCS